MLVPAKTIKFFNYLLAVLLIGLGFFYISQAQTSIKTALSAILLCLGFIGYLNGKIIGLQHEVRSLE